MKKIVTLVLALALVVLMLPACSENGGGDTDTGFKIVNGVAVCTDTTNSPFDGCGLKIEISHENGGSAKFTKTQTDGTETVDYYLFNYADNTMEKYYYVSAMGSAYYYTYDLNAGELVKVENGEHEDSTESMKSSGRWDSAAEKTKNEVKTLEDYFLAQYGVTIAQACADANFGK